MATYKTKLLALRACLAIWQELARSGASDKEDAYKALGLPVSRDRHGCPACEFTRKANSFLGRTEDCSKCPVWEGAEAYKCEVDGSPYAVWSFTSDSKIEQRKAAAQAMVALIEHRIAEERYRLSKPTLLEFAHRVQLAFLTKSRDLDSPYICDIAFRTIGEPHPGSSLYEVYKKFKNRVSDKIGREVCVEDMLAGRLLIAEYEMRPYYTAAYYKRLEILNEIINELEAEEKGNV